jgi:hypothetical protein
MGFAPCPSVDLIWHTHLCYPQLYQEDMIDLLNQTPMHKLLEEKDRTFVYMDDRYVK